MSIKKLLSVKEEKVFENPIKNQEASHSFWLFKNS